MSLFITDGKNKVSIDAEEYRMTLTGAQKQYLASLPCKFELKVASMYAASEIETLLEFSPGMSLEEVQAEYQEKIYSYMSDYLSSDKPITVDKNLYKRAINDAFTFAFIAGWADAGASELTSEAQSWLNGRIGEELGYLDMLFAQLKALRADKDTTLDEKLAAAEAHAAGYAASLNAIYSQGVLMGAPEMDLTFEGDDGSADSICQSIGGTCVKLRGQTHPASWWIENKLIPGPGNSNYDCGGWECKHVLVDKKGKVWAGGKGLF